MKNIGTVPIKPMRIWGDSLKIDLIRQIINNSGAMNQSENDVINYGEVIAAICAVIDYEG